MREAQRYFRRVQLSDWPLTRILTLLRFAAVGLASSVAYGLFMMLATELGGLEPRVSSAFAYLAAMIINFPLQRNFAFKSDGSLWVEIVKYSGVHFVNLLVSVATVHIVVNMLHWPVLVSILSVVIVIPLIQFLALEAWVFSSSRPR
jgi:putative flippase GtrA